MSAVPPPPAEGDVLPGPTVSPALLSYLAQRRSSKVAHLVEPGPEPEMLKALLTLAARVPDHGKLGPWRFIVLAGDRRRAYGEALATLLETRDPGVDAARLEQERGRFERGATCVAVVSSLVESAKIPQWEQELSAGAVCMNLLHAAHAAGFGACWLTEWPAYDADAGSALGLSPTERIAGFVYLGTPKEAPVERVRAPVEPRVAYF